MNDGGMEETEKWFDVRLSLNLSKLGRFRIPTPVYGFCLVLKLVN